MKKGSLKMKKTIALTSVIAITAVSVAVLVKKIISDNKFHDVEIINIDETCSNTPSSESNSDDGVSSIRIEEDTNSLTLIMEDDDIISSIKVLMNDEDCSSFKYAILETVLSQIENNDLEAARETMELMGI